MNVVVGGQSITGLDIYSYPLNRTVTPFSLCNDSVPIEINPCSSQTCAPKSSVVSTSLTLATAGMVHTFTILARDWRGQLSGVGGNLWNIISIDAESNKPEATIVDNYDGTYTCTFIATRSGLYSVSVRLLPLRTNVMWSPMPLKVLPSDIVDPKDCPSNTP